MTRCQTKAPVNDVLDASTPQATVQTISELIKFRDSYMQLRGDVAS